MEFTSRKLRAFHLVAQQRSFTKDAESLLLAVSQRSLEELDLAISRLERRAKVTAESLSVGATPLIGHKTAGLGALMRRPWRHHRADHAAFHLRFTG